MEENERIDLTAEDGLEYLSADDGGVEFSKNSPRMIRKVS